NCALWLAPSGNPAFRRPRPHRKSSGSGEILTSPVGVEFRPFFSIQACRDIQTNDRFLTTFPCALARMAARHQASHLLLTQEKPRPIGRGYPGKAYNLCQQHNAPEEETAGSRYTAVIGSARIVDLLGHTWIGRPSRGKGSTEFRY